MGMYFGRGKVKICVNNTTQRLKSLYKQHINLLTSDGYMLQSSDGFYLASFPSDISDSALWSSDGYILKDVNGLYLISKESE